MKRPEKKLQTFSNYLAREFSKEVISSDLFGKVVKQTNPTADSYWFFDYQLTIDFDYPKIILYKAMKETRESYTYVATSIINDQPITRCGIEEILEDKNMSNEIKEFFIFNLNYFNQQEYK